MKQTHVIPLGFTNVYLIGGHNRYLLVDGGGPNSARSFFKKIYRLNIEPGWIRLMVITHVHFDHAGGVNEIKAKCGCRVAVHRAEAPLLAGARVVIPPGTNIVTQKLCKIAGRHPGLVDRLYGFKAVEPDILVSDGMDLDDFGFKARIMMTPGHTPGSLSVLTGKGDAFVGDLAVNYYPFGLGPIFPPFAEDSGLIFKSWERLIQNGARRVFPAHGKVFDIERMKKKIR